MGGLSREAVETLQSAEEALPKNIESIELKDLSGVADTTSQSVEDVETTLKTINDPQIDMAWVAQTTRDMAGVREAMTRARDKLANNLVKLSATNDRKSGRKALGQGTPKLTEMDDTEIQQEIRDLMEKLKGELPDIQLERQARLEALSTNKAALRSQINRIRETIRQLLLEDKTLAEWIQTLFHQQGITIASIHTAVGMSISTLVLALTGEGAAGTPSPALKPSDKGGFKEWIKTPTDPWSCPGQFGQQGRCGPAQHHRLNRLLAPEHVREGRDLARWQRVALVISVGALLLMAARDWLVRPQLKRH